MELRRFCALLSKVCLYLCAQDILRLRQSCKRLCWVPVLQIDLSHNELSVLPAGIGKLTSLTCLDVSHNQLEGLPAAFGKLTSLTSLDLSMNMLEGLPAEIGKLRSLTKLNLSDNGLKGLPAGELRSLSELDLSDNVLEVLPAEIWNMPSLTKLNISHNNKLKVSSADIVFVEFLTELAVSTDQLIEPAHFWCAADAFDVEICTV